MKKTIYSLILVSSLAFVFSCADDSLDPLNTKTVKKGTLLALRGTQLNNLYVLGKPGAEVFPKIMNGTESFSFDSEYLANDPTSLASVDFYVIKKTGSATSRVLVQNYPGSNWVVGTYKGPSGNITVSMATVLSKLGLPVYTDPIYQGNAGNPLLTTYQPGINFEIDLNLKDGTQILAADIIAAGLFQSNQFYPAMLLTWTMTDYCTYVAASWSGVWNGDEVGPLVGGTDKNAFTAVAADTWQMDNFWGYKASGPAVLATIKFTPSVNPATQVVAYVNDAGKTFQSTQDCFYTGSCLTATISGTGTYNQCTATFSIQTTYIVSGTTYKFAYNFHR